MHEAKTAKLYLKTNYQNLGFIKSIKNLSYSPNSASYYFHTENGKYVLKYIKDHHFPTKIAQTCKILK